MFELAWKNILSYKGRSVTTFLLTFTSVYLFIIYVAFMNGAHRSMLKNALDIYTGSLRIYHKDYRSKGGNDYLIEDVQKPLGILQDTKGIKAYTSRLETYGLASSQSYTSAIMLAGVDFQKEAKISALKRAFVKGTYNSRGNCIYIGENLAKKLHTGLDKEVSFVGSAVDDSFVAEIFKVCGIFKTGMYDFDSQSAFVNRSYFDSVFLSKNMATYVVAMADNLKNNDQIAQKIKEELPPQMQLYTWKTLMKSMVELMQMDSFFGYVSMGLFFCVIFFVIMIYGFINVNARMKEFGILRAIGVSDRRVSALLLMEILLLTMVAMLLAVPLGAYTAYYFQEHPIVIAGMSDMYKSYGVVSDKVPTLFDPFTIAWNSTLVFALNLLSILYPIAYVRSFTPIEEIEHV
jgi:ABC-type lipoprotein release transport system permease subunit